MLASRPGGIAAAEPAALTATAVSPELGGVSGAPIPGSLGDPEIASRFINLKDRTNLSFTEKGEIYANGDLIGQVSLVEFSDPRFLQKTGMQYFVNTDPAKNTLVEPTNSKIHQGMLEGSNVNPVEEMTNLIKANRLFEHDLKVMKTYGEMMGREANDIGKL